MTACAWELQIQFQPCCLWPLINVKCGRSTSETPLLPAFFVFAPRTKAAVQCRCAGNYPLRHAGKTHFQSLVQGAAEDRPPRLILKTPVLAERKRESPAAAFTLYTSCGTRQQTIQQPHRPRQPSRTQIKASYQSTGQAETERSKVQGQPWLYETL